MNPKVTLVLATVLPSAGPLVMVVSGGVASLLCEIHGRLRLLGLAEGGAIQLPLTQEDIGDATGLTAVHVNRMMRGLVEDGVIERSGNMLTVLDTKRLCAEASFNDRLELETGWLPPPVS